MAMPPLYRELRQNRGLYRLLDGEVSGLKRKRQSEEQGQSKGPARFRCREDV
jgi:hypothetical protein